MTAQQDRQMRAIAAQFEVTSNGTTAGYEVVPTSGSFSSAEPRSGDANPPHIRYVRLYNKCQSNEARARVIREAELELLSLGHSRPAPVVTETLEQRNKRIVAEGEGFPAMEVAIRFRTGVRAVWAARREGEREKDFGRPVEPERSPAERRRRVAELKSQGMTVRQIALVVQASPATITEDLKHAA